MKELSYAVRHCHLNTTNIDGTPASSFGFEITRHAEYEYPIITRVDAKSPGDQSGLQVEDILLKVNDRKTKGAGFEKIQKAIEKAKNNGRLEMLVVDKETFHYCLKTNRKFKEPFIKVKHFFPRTRSTVNYESLSLIAGRASLTTQESFEQSVSDTDSCDNRRLSTQSENVKVNLKSSSFERTNQSDLPLSKLLDSTRRSSARRMKIATTNSNISHPIQEIQNETSADESIMDFVLNTVNSFFHNIGSEKSTNRS